LDSTMRFTGRMDMAASCLVLQLPTVCECRRQAVPVAAPASDVQRRKRRIASTHAGPLRQHEPAEGRFSEAKEGAAAQRRRRAPVKVAIYS